MTMTNRFLSIAILCLIVVAKPAPGFSDIRNHRNVDKSAKGRVQSSELGGYASRSRRTLRWSFISEQVRIGCGICQRSVLSRAPQIATEDIATKRNIYWTYPLQQLLRRSIFQPISTLELLIVTPQIQSSSTYCPFP